MTISSTRPKLASLAAGLAAGTFLFAAGGTQAAPQIGGVGAKPLEPIVYTAARRDHRTGDSKSTSSAQGGVTVGGKETNVKRSPTCGYGCNPSAQWGENWQNVPKGNLRDHRTKGPPWGGR
jgi:hypothetical protein